MNKSKKNNVKPDLKKILKNVAAGAGTIAAMSAIDPTIKYIGSNTGLDDETTNKISKGVNEGLTAALLAKLATKAAEIPAKKFSFLKPISKFLNKHDNKIAIGAGIAGASSDTIGNLIENIFETIGMPVEKAGDKNEDRNIDKKDIGAKSNLNKSYVTPGKNKEEIFKNLENKFLHELRNTNNPSKALENTFYWGIQGKKEDSPQYNYVLEYISNLYNKYANRNTQQTLDIKQDNQQYNTQQNIKNNKSQFSNKNIPIYKKPIQQNINNTPDIQSFPQNKIDQNVILENKIQQQKDIKQYNDLITRETNSHLHPRDRIFLNLENYLQRILPQDEVPVDTLEEFFKQAARWGLEGKKEGTDEYKYVQEWLKWKTDNLYSVYNQNKQKQEKYNIEKDVLLPDIIYVDDENNIYLDKPKSIEPDYKDIRYKAISRYYGFNYDDFMKNPDLYKDDAIKKQVDTAYKLGFGFAQPYEGIKYYIFTQVTDPIQDKNYRPIYKHSDEYKKYKEMIKNMQFPPVNNEPIIQVNENIKKFNRFNMNPFEENQY